MYFRAGENPKFWELKGHILGSYYFILFFGYDRHEYIYQTLFHSMRSVWVGERNLQAFALTGSVVWVTETSEDESFTELLSTSVKHWMPVEAVPGIVAAWIHACTSAQT